MNQNNFQQPMGTFTVPAGTYQQQQEFLNGLGYLSPDTLFATADDIYQSSQFGKARSYEPNKDDDEPIEIEFGTQRDFPQDYHVGIITSSEICSDFAELCGDVFSDFIGCTETGYLQGPVFGIRMYFSLNAHQQQDPKDQRIAGIEIIDKEEKMDRFLNSMNNNFQYNQITPNQARFRLSNDAIKVIKRYFLDFKEKDNKDNTRFRNSEFQYVKYGFDPMTRQECVMVDYINIERVISLIYGEDYAYRILPGNRSKNSRFGYLLEVSQINKKHVKDLESKYLGVTRNDGMYRPRRK